MVNENEIQIDETAENPFKAKEEEQDDVVKTDVSVGKLKEEYEQLKSKGTLKEE